MWKNFFILGLILAFVSGYFISRNYSFKVENKKTVVIPSQSISPKPKKEENKPLVGNDKDKHGCIGSAGYTWCEIKQKCLKTWEEKCEEENDENDIKKTLLIKQGWNENKVDITVSKEDGTFAQGGIKEKAAAGGGMFLAKKIDDKWEIVFEGNGIPDCDLLKSTSSFPTDFLVGVCD